MKTYKYSTKERAERVAKTLGCSGSHYHNEDGGKKFMPCKDMKTFKEKTKKESKGKEEEVTELIDGDGTWLSSDIPNLDPASSLKGSTYTDKIVAMSRMPRDPLLRGWYGYYGEGHIKEEDMGDAFGFEDTMFMDYEDTVKHYQKKLGLDKEAAIQRAKQQGKKLGLDRKTPKNIKKKKNFIDRLILKEKGVDESEDIIEDVLLDKGSYRKDISIKKDDINPLLLRNIRSLKRMAKDNGLSLQQLIKMIKDE